MKCVHGICAGLLLAAVASSPAAVAQTPQGSPPDWLSQAKIIAEMQGITVGEAVRRSRLQILANRQAERFAQDDNFAGSWIQQDRNGYKVTYAFRGGGNRTIADPELAAASNFENARYSLREIADERRRLTRLLEAQGISVGFEGNVVQNRLYLYPGDPAKVKELVSSGALTLRDFVVVLDMPLKRRREAAIEGAGPTTGEYIDPTDGLRYGSNCAAGLVVVGSGTRGISTAGHCAKYSGQTSLHNSLNIGTRKGYREDSGFDVAWFRNDANTYRNRVRLSSTTYYTITEVAPLNPNRGSYVCVIRRNMTQACAYTRTNDIWFGSDGPYSAADRDLTIEQDSGAPWLYGGLAYGIHSGDAETSVGVLSFWTQAAMLPNMGITVATTDQP